MNKVKVPRNVHEAFQYHKKIFATMNYKQTLHMYMSIPSARVNGPSYVLKKFAEKHPRLYIDAFLYGCEPESDMREELTNMLDEWLSKPYVSNEKIDVEIFANELINFFQKQT